MIRTPVYRGPGETISSGKRSVTRAGLVLLCAVAIVVVLLTSFRLPDAPWIDLFNEGEYLSPQLYFDAPGAAPLLIHGQMDL